MIMKLDKNTIDLIFYLFCLRGGGGGGGGGGSPTAQLRGCLYGDESARPAELIFISCSHETFEAGWLAKTNYGLLL